ncbi:hypothetical protein MPER_01136, partial [Moniliophthora perniciosa FA553]
TSWMKTGLSLILVFDGLAFIAILVVTLKMISKRDRHSSLLYILKVIRRDGVLYFFVLFSSNFVWLLLIAYARPVSSKNALKYLSRGIYASLLGSIVESVSVIQNDADLAS